MTQRLKVEGHSDYVRDPNSHAILNINTSAIEKARIVKERRQQTKDEYHLLKTDVSELKDTMKDIQMMLKQLTRDS